jgi:hypothetical protein
MRNMKFSSDPGTRAHEAMQAFLEYDHTTRSPDLGTTGIRNYKTSNLNHTKLTNILGIEMKDLQSLSTMTFDKRSSQSADRRGKKTKLFTRKTADGPLNKSFNIFKTQTPTPTPTADPSPTPTSGTPKDPSPYPHSTPIIRPSFFPKLKVYESLNEQQDAIEKINLLKRKLKFKTGNSRPEMIANKINYPEIYRQKNASELEDLEYLEKSDPFVAMQPNFFRKKHDQNHKAKILNHWTVFLGWFNGVAPEGFPDKKSSLLGLRVLKSMEGMANEYKVDVGKVRSCLFKGIFCEKEKSREKVVEVLRRLTNLTGNEMVIFLG